MCYVLCDMNKWKDDLYRFPYYLTQELINKHGYIFIDISDFENETFTNTFINSHKEMPKAVLYIESHGDKYIDTKIRDIREYLHLFNLYLFSDDHHKSEEYKKETKYYDMFKKIFVTYKVPFCNRYPDVDSEKVYFLPHAVPDEYDISFNETPNNKILMIGNIKKSVYPARRYFSILANRVNYREKLKLIDHASPHYLAVNVNSTKQAVGKNYIKTNSEYICAFTCSSTSRYVLMKYFEIPFSGALLYAFSDTLDDLEKLGFVPGVNYLESETGKDGWIKKMDWILDPSNREEIDNIRRNGYKLIRERHLVSHRTKELVDVINIDLNIYQEL